MLDKNCNIFLTAELLHVCMHAAFRDGPPTPPSVSRQLESSEHVVNVSFGRRLLVFVGSVLSAFKNGYFILFMITSGMHVNKQ